MHRISERCQHLTEQGTNAPCYRLHRLSSWSKLSGSHPCNIQLTCKDTVSRAFNHSEAALFRAALLLFRCLYCLEARWLERHY